MKSVILGNSGSGKTWLAHELAVKTGATLVHLDEFFWQPGGFDRQRLPMEVAALVASARSGPEWIVEGVFADLAVDFLRDADALVWLDLDWAVCKARLLARGSESKAHMARAQSAAGLAKLIDWAATYGSRGDMRSHAGHLAVFAEFSGPKLRLRSQSEVTALLERWPGFDGAAAPNAAGASVSRSIRTR